MQGLYETDIDNITIADGPISTTFPEKDIPMLLKYVVPSVVGLAVLIVLVYLAYQAIDRR